MVAGKVEMTTTDNNGSIIVYDGTITENDNKTTINFKSASIHTTLDITAIEREYVIEGATLTCTVKMASSTHPELSPHLAVTLTHQPDKYKEILFQDLKDPNSYIIADVREDAEYAAGHIPNAVSLPVGTILSKCSAVGTETYSFTHPQPGDNRLRVIACQSGFRAAEVTKILRKVIH